LSSGKKPWSRFWDQEKHQPGYATDDQGDCLDNQNIWTNKEEEKCGD